MYTTKITKANLHIIKNVCKDKAYPEFSKIFILKDGTTVSFNRTSLTTVSPKQNEDGSFPAPTEEGIALDPKDLVPFLKTIPKDNDEISILWDEKNDQAETQASGLKYSLPRKLIQDTKFKLYDWKEVVGDSFHKIKNSDFKQAEKRTNIDRIKLIELLKIVDDCCYKKSNPIVCIESGNEDTSVLIRAFNFQTKQSIIAVLAPCSVPQDYFEYNKWEEEIFSHHDPEETEVKKKKPMPRKKDN